MASAMLATLSCLLRSYPEILLAAACPLLAFLYRQSSRNPANPTNWPLLGMLPGLLWNLGRFHDWATASLRASGCTLEFHGPWLLGQDFLVTCDPANVNHVFNANFANYPKGEEFSEVFDVLGEGIFNSDNEQWRSQRRMAHAAMSSPKFRAFVARCSREKVENALVPLLGKLAREGGVVDLQDVFLRLTFDMTCNLVFGVDPGSLSEGLPTIPFARAMDDAMDRITISMEKRGGRVAVVVLGDIGRSPRMQYHALSLAQQAHLEVDIVANGGSDPHNALKENQSIHIHTMRSVDLHGLSKISKVLALVCKAAMQFVILVWFLCFKIPRPDVFLVQNPPSVPTLAAVKLCSWLRRSAFVIDWHNFGYTLLSLSHGRSHIIVKIYHWFEKYFGRMATGSLCVTKAMQHELAQNWGIKAIVLYDQPPEFFHPATLKEKLELFCRLESDICHPNDIRDCASIGSKGQDNGAHNHSCTLFTVQIGNDIHLKPNRPALVVSSTSWTPDEDFSILLEAAVMYDRRVAAVLNEDDSIEEEKHWKVIHNGQPYLYPRLLFIVTGKGPERSKYEEKIKKLNLRRVAFRTMWLSAEDYPLLLGSADLGVSLHTSSSGLDLPMKVVDMFGCGLPVCAVSFSCIDELVKVEKNGLLFSSSSELADEFMMLFKGFPENCDALKSLRDGALATGSSARWPNEWETHALPFIREVVSGEHR